MSARVVGHIYTVYKLPLAVAGLAIAASLFLRPERPVGRELLRRGRARIFGQTAGVMDICFRAATGAAPPLGSSCRSSGTIYCILLGAASLKFAETWFLGDSGVQVTLHAHCLILI